MLPKLARQRWHGARTSGLGPGAVSDLSKKRALKKRIRGEVSFEFDYDPYTETYDDFRSKFLPKFKHMHEELQATEVAEEAIRTMASEAFDRWCEHSEEAWIGISDAIAGESEDIEEIRAADAIYRLRRVVRATARTTSEGTWLFEVDGFPQRFVGEGRSLGEARDDWQHAVHSAFQSLVRLRPFRMSGQQRQDWDLLERLIDVEHYWRTTPMKLRELGFVSAVRHGPCQVTWLDGMQIEDVALGQMPQEFAGYAEGQWFEAIVEREPGSHALRRVCYVQPVDPLPEMSEDELKSWYESLPGPETLPPSDSDWPTL